MDNQQKTDRPMFTGNWKCSNCEGAITQLPFEPAAGRENTLVCLECYRSRQGSQNSASGGEKKMFDGNWSCSKCNTDIKSLPFEPTPGRENTLVCRDCYRNR